MPQAAVISLQERRSGFPALVFDHAVTERGGGEPRPCTKEYADAFAAMMGAAGIEEMIRREGRLRRLELDGHAAPRPRASAERRSPAA